MDAICSLMVDELDEQSARMSQLDTMPCEYTSLLVDLICHGILSALSFVLQRTDR